MKPQIHSIEYRNKFWKKGRTQVVHVSNDTLVYLLQNGSRNDIFLKITPCYKFEYDIQTVSGVGPKLKVKK